MDNNQWFKDADDQTRVLIAHQSANGNGKFITLRHPKSGNNTPYILTHESLHELHWFKQPYTSWFLGNYVSENGSLYLLTPIDLVFILLPLLDEARMKKGSECTGNFRLLEEILFVNDYPDYCLLMPFAERFVSVVCDVKESGDLKFVRLDDGKVLDWLVFKVNQLKDVLPKLDGHYAEREERDTIVDTILIIGEYLEEKWVKCLCERLKLRFEELCVTQSISVGVSGGNGEGIETNVFQAKAGGEKKNGKTGKQVKKQKLETKSQNIGDMFRRVTRRG